MKKILVLILMLSILFFSGFGKKYKAVLIISANKITNASVKVIENNFNAQSRIFYALYAPDGFRQEGVRLQISKQNDKTSNWGFSIVMSKDIYLDLSQKVYHDYIYVQQSGHYILQFFYLDNKDYPFAHREFRVH